MENIIYRKILRSSLLFLLIYPLSLILYPFQAHADSIALGIYPPIIKITAKAPSDIKSPMTVSNQSDTPVDVHIGVRPFTQGSSDNGQPRYLTPGQRVGEDAQIYQKMAIFDGIQNTDMLTLAPNQKRNIELRIHLPSGEPPGDYYFSIVFISNPILTDHQSGTEVAGGVSTNVLLSIGPYDTTTGYMKEFSSPLFLTQGPVPFSVNVANTSKHFISPQGTILVKNMFGQIIGKVNLSQENVLAGTSRYLPDDVVQNTKYKILNTSHPTANWQEQFLLGPYSASLNLVMSEQGPRFVRTIYFFALPIQVLIGVMLGIILVGIVVYRVRKRLH